MERSWNKANYAHCSSTKSITVKLSYVSRLTLVDWSQSLKTWSNMTHNQSHKRKSIRFSSSSQCFFLIYHYFSSHILQTSVFLFIMNNINYSNFFSIHLVCYLPKYINVSTKGHQNKYAATQWENEILKRWKKVNIIKSSDQWSSTGSVVR